MIISRTIIVPFIMSNALSSLQLGKQIWSVKDKIEKCPWFLNTGVPQNVWNSRDFHMPQMSGHLVWQHMKSSRLEVNPGLGLMEHRYRLCVAVFQKYFEKYGVCIRSSFLEALRSWSEFMFAVIGSGYECWRFFVNFSDIVFTCWITFYL